MSYSISIEYEKSYSLRVSLFRLTYLLNKDIKELLNGGR